MVGEAVSRADLPGRMRASRELATVVEALSAGPATPTEIAGRTGMHRANVSRALGKLRSCGVVDCLTPTLRKGRLYALRAEGRVTLSLWEQWEDLPLEVPTAIRGPRFAPRVRGSVLLATVAAASEMMDGDEMVRLSRACGFNFLRLDRETWYAVYLYHVLLRHLADRTRRNDPEACRRIGCRTVSYLPFLQRFLASHPLNVAALAERMPLVHEYYFNFGRLEVRSLPDAHELLQYDFMPTQEACMTLLGTYEGILEAVGLPLTAREVRCATRGDPACAFRLSPRRGGVRSPRIP